MCLATTAEYSFCSYSSGYLNRARESSAVEQVSLERLRKEIQAATPKDCKCKAANVYIERVQGFRGS